MEMVLTEAKVKLFVTNDNNQLLLIREVRPRYVGTRWNIISGTVELGDETITEAAEREAREEAGVSIQPAIVGLYAVRHAVTTPDEIPGKRLSLDFIVHGQTNDKPRLAPGSEQASRNEHILDARWHTQGEVSRLTSDEVAGEFVAHLLHNFYAELQDPPAFYTRTFDEFD